MGTGKFGLNDSPNPIASVPGAGTVYRFGAWVRSTTATGKAQIRIREYLGGVQQGSSIFSPDVPLSPIWKKASLDYVAGATGSNIDFNVLYAPVGVSEKFQVDNISAYQDYWISAVGEDAGGGLSFAAAMSPNPVRHDASILFATSRAGFVRVRLYDAAGRLVRRLLEEPSLLQGRHAARFDGHDAAGRPFPSGIYFYRVEAVEGSIRGRFIVLR